MEVLLETFIKNPAFAMSGSGVVIMAIVGVYLSFKNLLNFLARNEDSHNSAQAESERSHSAIQIETLKMMATLLERHDDRLITIDRTTAKHYEDFSSLEFKRRFDAIERKLANYEKAHVKTLKGLEAIYNKIKGKT